VIAGCPVNGPAIDARGADLVVAWYTELTGRPVVRAAFSSDSGAKFGRPATIDVSGPLGRVDVVLLESGDAVVSWLDVQDGHGVVRLRRVDRAGEKGPVVSVASTGMTRRVGVPKVERIDQELLVVWTDDAPVRRLRAVTVPIAAIP
ncbi:MAG: hypothetical protein ACYTGC_14645, partial [Planctomycetota bacterium]